MLGEVAVVVIYVILRHVADPKTRRAIADEIRLIAKPGDGTAD